MSPAREGTAEVNGIRMHFLTVARDHRWYSWHGWPETASPNGGATSLPMLECRHTLIAPDLRGLRVRTDAPPGGLTTKRTHGRGCPRAGASAGTRAGRARRPRPRGRASPHRWGARLPDEVERRGFPGHRAHPRGDPPLWTPRSRAAFGTGCSTSSRTCPSGSSWARARVPRVLLRALDVAAVGARRCGRPRTCEHSRGPAGLRARFRGLTVRRSPPTSRPTSESSLRAAGCKTARCSCMWGAQGPGWRPAGKIRRLLGSWVRTRCACRGGPRLRALPGRGEARAGGPAAGGLPRRTLSRPQRRCNNRRRPASRRCALLGLGQSAGFRMRYRRKPPGATQHDAGGQLRGAASAPA